MGRTRFQNFLSLCIHRKERATEGKIPVIYTDYSKTNAEKMILLLYGVQKGGFVLTCYFRDDKSPATSGAESLRFYDLRAYAHNNIVYVGHRQTSLHITRYVILTCLRACVLRGFFFFYEWFLYDDHNNNNNING